MERDWAVPEPFRDSSGLDQSHHNGDFHQRSVQGGRQTQAGAIGKLDFDALAMQSQMREENDRATLVQLGKRPVLQRSFGFMSILGFTCIILATWEGALVTLDIGLVNGGPSGIIYMFIVAWVGTWCTFATLSELVSMAPISAGQYFWVAMLAPPSMQKFLSYITGWSTLMAWQALTSTTAFISGTGIQAIIALLRPDYNPERYQGTLIIWAVLLWSFFTNTVGRRVFHGVEGLILVIHVMGFFGVLIPLVVLCSKKSSSDAFSDFSNGGQWQTQGLSTIIGILGSIYVFTGPDGAYHLAEEIKNASTVVPRSIMVSMAINGAFGFAILTALAYAIRDSAALLASPAGHLGNAYLTVLSGGIGSAGGAAAMGAVVIFLEIFSNVSDMAAASRILWAFARDRAVPWSGFFAQLSISRSSTLPIRAIVFSVIVPALLAIINIGSSTAFNDVVGLTTAAFYFSYLMATGLLLYRRLTGAILHPDDPSILASEAINHVGKRLVWGPWRVPGLFGVMVNCFAVVYLTFALFFSFWPADRHVTASTMNYNVLVFGTVMIAAVLYYPIRRKRHYNGPVIETENVQDK